MVFPSHPGFLNQWLKNACLFRLEDVALLKKDVAFKNVLPRIFFFVHSGVGMNVLITFYLFSSFYRLILFCEIYVGHS